jgi:hypothetical protein
MSTGTDPIIDALDKLVAPFPEEDGDWEQIVRQARLEAPAPRRPRRRWRAAAVPTLAAIAAAVTVALLWPFSSSPSVLDNALAAVGTGPVTHVVLADNLGSYLLDLRSGAHKPVTSREEIWYQANRGMLIRTTFLGRPAAKVWVPLPGGSPVSAYISSFPTSFVSGYRAQLRTHAYHVIGSGTIAGTAVYWIESKPRVWGNSPSHSVAGQVAISKATYKPLYARYLRDGRIVRGSGVRVLAIETTSRIPTRPAATSWQQALNSGQSYGFPPLTLKQAETMRPAPVIPKRIAGLKLSWIGLATAINTAWTRPPGVWLYYGATQNGGFPNDTQPSYKGSYVEIFELPREDSFTRFFAGHFPSGKIAVIDALSAYSQHTATLKAHSLYIVVRASSDQPAVAAAHTIAR